MYPIIWLEAWIPNFHFSWGEKLISSLYHPKSAFSEKSAKIGVFHFSLKYVM
jgi:hypothetical protein